MAILVLPALAVVLGLVVHSLKFRGRRETLAFFLAAAVFGILRGNIIWWITTVHFQGKFPYIFQRHLLGVYHDSFTADAGWILCLYLGTFLAWRITERAEALRGKAFPLISLACLFHACLSYAVESTAITMGWWQWTLSTKSTVLRDVPTTGIWAWFSVGFDFLVPYVLIRHVRKPGQLWPYLTLFLFPLHMAMHLGNARASDLIPITPYGIYHWIMLLAVLVLPFASDLRLRRPWLPERALGRTGSGARVPGVGAALWRSIPFLGLAVVVGVLLFCDLGLHGEPGLLIAKVPLALFTLLAVPVVPVWAVLVAAGVLAGIGGRYLLVPLLVPGFYLALRGRELWPRRPWLRWAYLLVPVALTVWHVGWSQAKNKIDMHYWDLVNRGTALAKADPKGAADELQQAVAVKPYSIPAYEKLVVVYAQMQDYDDALGVLRKMLELRPISEEVHANFGTVYVMMGNYDEAERWFQKALEINPDHAYSRRMLANMDRLRRGEAWKVAPEGG